MAFSQSDARALMERYLAAHVTANGYAYEGVIKYHSGWFTMTCGVMENKLRRDAVEKACERLEERAAQSCKHKANESKMRRLGADICPESTMTEKDGNYVLQWRGNVISLLKPVDDRFVVYLGKDHPQFSGDGLWAAFDDEDTALLSLYSVCAGGVRSLIGSNKPVLQRF